MVSVLTEEAAKAKAKALHKGLLDMSFPVKHAQALELVARMEGYPTWAALNAAQSRMRSEPAAAATVTADSGPAWVLVGAENLLEGWLQDDPLPCDSTGGKRKDALYEALRLCGAEWVYLDPVVTTMQERGGFSAPPASSRPALPQDDTRYENDPEPCNRFGETRMQALKFSMDNAGLDPWVAERVFEEYAARSGFVRCYAR